METAASSGQGVLQLRAVLRDISPLIWRRLLVRVDLSIAQLHHILQVAFGWQDMHLHRFEIRGREYGIHQEGGTFSMLRRMAWCWPSSNRSGSC